jgi:hypothetical protein
MQYFDMGGNGTPTDTGCDNCHSASQYRTLNYTTRNIAGGAEVKLGSLMKLVYQHEFRSFNDRMPNPSDFYGASNPNLDTPRQTFLIPLLVTMFTAYYHAIKRSPTCSRSAWRSRITLL